MGSGASFFSGLLNGIGDIQQRNLQEKHQKEKEEAEQWRKMIAGYSDQLDPNSPTHDEDVARLMKWYLSPFGEQDQNKKQGKSKAQNPTNSKSQLSPWQGDEHMGHLSKLAAGLNKVFHGIGQGAKGIGRGLEAFGKNEAASFSDKPRPLQRLDLQQIQKMIGSTEDRAKWDQEAQIRKVQTYAAVADVIWGPTTPENKEQKASFVKESVTGKADNSMRPVSSGAYGVYDPNKGEIIPPAPRADKPKTVTPAQQIKLDAYAKSLGKTADQLSEIEKGIALSDPKALRTSLENAQSKQIKRAMSQTGAITHEPSSIIGGDSKLNPVIGFNTKSGIAIRKDPGLDIAAWDFIFDEKMIYMGMGDKGADYRKKVLARSGELLSDLGIDPSQLPLVRSALKSNQKALNTITNQGALIETAERTLEQNLKLVKGLSEKYDRTGSPLINRVQNYLQGRVSGDPDVNNLVGGMTTLVMEYAKVLGGGSGAQGAKVSDEQSAKEFLSQYLSNGSLDSLFENLIKPELKNRSQAIKDEKTQLLQDIGASIKAPSEAREYKVTTLQSGNRDESGGPKKDDIKTYHGATYKFDGNVWRKQNKQK